jgi:hypothetical protein
MNGQHATSKRGDTPKSTSMITPGPHPKDSMKSTWRTNDQKEWTIFHWFYEVLRIHFYEPRSGRPGAFQKGPRTIFVGFRTTALGDHSRLHPPRYSPSLCVLHRQQIWPYRGILLLQLRIQIDRHPLDAHDASSRSYIWGHIYGFFDGDKHERDGAPDIGVAKVVASLVSASTVRPMMFVFLAYRTSQMSESISWTWLPLEIGLYGITLDLWFY